MKKIIYLEIKNVISPRVRYVNINSYEMPWELVTFVVRCMEYTLEYIIDWAAIQSIGQQNEIYPLVDNLYW